MSRVRAFFLREAGECLSDMASELERTSLDVTALHRAVRRFRGSAQMARFGALAEAARALETRLRGPLGHAVSGETSDAGGRASGSQEELRREAWGVLESLERGVEAVREGRLEEDPRMEVGMEQQGGDESGDELNVVPIGALEYRGEAALERALELREALEEAIVGETPTGPILDELFDLVRLGSK